MSNEGKYEDFEVVDPPNDFTLGDETLDEKNQTH